MPACGGDFGLRVLDGAGSSTERNPQAPEALLELEAGKLEQLGRLPEIDLLGEVIAEDPSFQQIAVGISPGGAKGESPPAVKVIVPLVLLGIAAAPWALRPVSRILGTAMGEPAPAMTGAHGISKAAG
jgi:hypothetical protein